MLTSLPEAMRVLTSPAETGAVTISFPQDVQAEAFDFPEEFFKQRSLGDPAHRAAIKNLLNEAVGWIRASKKPLIVAGGGVLYSEASEALAKFAQRRAFQSARRRPVKARCPLTIRNNSVPWE